MDRDLVAEVRPLAAPEHNLDINPEARTIWGGAASPGFSLCVRFSPDTPSVVGGIVPQGELQ